MQYIFYRYLTFLMISSSRKQSYDAYDDQSQQICSFPHSRSVQEVNHSAEELKRHYDQTQHSFRLINYLYRCHNPEFVQSYSLFQNGDHPELNQPRMSRLYHNASFVDLLAFDRAIDSGNAKEVLHIAPIPKTFKTTLDNLFNCYGYIPNLQRFLLFYPSYLERHITLERELLDSDKMDAKITNFLALVAAAEMGSVYMMARYLKRYFKSGGELDWLTKGVYPKKLKPILKLNRIMSHSTWEITPQIIVEILENQSFRWSINELAFMIHILAFAHNDATIALAMGLIPQELDILKEINLEKILRLKSMYDEKTYESSGENIQKHEEMMQAIERMDYDENEQEMEEETMQETLLAKREVGFSLTKSQFIEPYMKEIGNELVHQQLYKEVNVLLRPLLQPFQVIECRDEEKYPNVDYSEYNYKFMTYPILHNLTQSIADKLENLIECAETMTRGNFGSMIHQTKQFRKSVRYYGENLCGYTHQEYDYKNNLSAYLTVPLKFYIKLLMLSPLHINKRVIEEIRHEGGQIECFDLGHIAILSATAKMSLELTLTVQAFQL